MKKSLFIILAVVVFTGAGCKNKVFYNSSPSVNSKAKPVENFCDKQKEDAEKKIKTFKLTEDKKIAHELWKRSFLKFNNISEEFFKTHIFVTRISEQDYPETDPAKTYQISYYYKLEDVYLYSGTIDDIGVWRKSLDDFKKESVENLLKAPTVVDKPRETHPNFGKTPNSAFYKYQWGHIRVNNIAAQPSSILSCKDAVAMLKNCRQDILPTNIIYKGLLGQAWLRGFAGGEEKSSDCASATVILFSKQLDSCNVNISCSQIIP